MLDVALVGTGGTMPLPGRWLSAVLVRVGSDLILFDCGEGTQISLRRLGWGLKAIGTIGLSHMHADHVGGLPGLLLTVGNAGRTAPVRIFGPAGTADTVAALRSIAPELPFEVVVHELDGGEAVDVGAGRLSALGLDHGMPCLAYRIDVPRGRRFDADRARALGVPVALWRPLQDGRVVDWDGRRVGPDDVLGPQRRGLRIAYVTDTRPTTDLPSFAAGADLLICEGTYGDPADAENAVQNKHMLFSEAAAIARAAGVRELWLTHFSAKLSDPERYADQATAIFPPSVVGRDHLAASFRFVDSPDEKTGE